MVIKRAVSIYRPHYLDFLWGWTKTEVYKRKVDTRGELLARILVTVTPIKCSEDKLGRKTAVFP